MVIAVALYKHAGLPPFLADWLLLSLTRSAAAWTPFASCYWNASLPGGKDCFYLTGEPLPQLKKKKSQPFILKQQCNWESSLYWI